MAGENEKSKDKAPATPEGPRKLDRREVLKGLSTVPALGVFGYAWNKQRQYQQARLEAASAPPVAPAGLQHVNVALIGAGAQGQVLTDAMLRIPGLRFRAVCDVWTEYNQKRVVNSLRRFKHEVTGYEDYREMLDKEKELDAVIIATPDFWHAQHTIDCLKAGKHVYCEKEMSNTLESARSMVAAARETGKLLQIGHQRRSNPRYLHCHDKLLGEAKLLGRIVTVNGQWNRAVAADLGAPDRYVIPQARLKQYRLQGHAPVPQLALVQGPRRRSDRRPGLSPDRYLHVVPRWQPLPCDGERRAPVPRSKNARVVRHGDGRVPTTRRRRAR